MSVAPSLTERAFDALRSGPRTTQALAGEVLRLSGPEAAVSAAVHALLERDDRFEVDGAGWWTLRDGAEEPGPDLRRVPFAVVDLETTGGPRGAGHRITDLAIVRVEGGQITRDYATLVNPGRSIPFGISLLTGIVDEMVVHAPYFEDVADRVVEELRGCVFVAHNVAFDWGFLRGQCGEAGLPVPTMRRLCTVKMARALVPELRRRNLDALADHFDVPIFERHRALGDATATARVLIRLLDRATGQGLRDLPALERHLRKARGRRRRGRGRRRPGSMRRHSNTFMQEGPGHE